MMEALGARLFSIWETTPYNGHWPQVTIIWEIDAFAIARIGRAQAPGGSHREGPSWSDYLAGVGATGEGRKMYAGRSNRTLAQLQEAKFGAGLVIPGDHADEARQAGRLHPGMGAAVRALVGTHR